VPQSVHRFGTFSVLYPGKLDPLKGLKMKRLLLAGVTGAALVCSAPTHAADLGRRPPPYKAPPPVVAPVPIFTWSGCYIGGHLGGGWGRKTASAAELLPGVLVSGDTSGFLGGGQIGCNYQFLPNWVIGIEGDGSAADIKGDVTETILGITGTAHAKQSGLQASRVGSAGPGIDG
jgi:outer membrane immunogenic protein